MTTFRLFLMQSNSTLTLLQQQKVEPLRRKNNNDHETLIRVATQCAEYKIETIMEKFYKSKDVKVEEEVYESLSECIAEASKSIDYVRKELESSLKNRLQEATTSSFAIDYFCLYRGFTEGSLQLDDNSIVGRESEVEDMRSEITRTWSDKREVVAIAGMGVIGKTTLARRVYSDPVIKVHFEVRVWATMSKVVCIRNMLLELLRCIEGLGCEGNGVIDDIWSTNAWDDINQWFPDSKGSQVLLTTRCKNVACYAAPGKSPHQLSLLNRMGSWKLFQEKIFAKEQKISSEFLEIGKKIARNCHGLPLTIVIVSGLLSTSNNVLDIWRQVERNVRTTLFEDGYRQCEKVLALSYYYLPQHLKADSCTQLIKLWVAEGFLREEADKSLVDVGEECLDELIDRNLIFISEHSFTGKAKRCEIHDLLYYEIDVRNSYRYHDQKKIRSFICSGESSSFSYLVFILDIEYREDLLLSNLPNLQTLVVHDISYGKSTKLHVIHLEIWSMPLLRNLHSKRSSLISPPSMSNGKTKQAILEHLHTITGVDPAWCKKEIFARMPNVKKLGIKNYRVLDLWEDLPCLSEVKSIEALSISSEDSWKFIFPPALKKLTLIKLSLSWEDMDIVGTLPCLEVLKLRRHTCNSCEWEPAIGATEKDFPVLERLYISGCSNLEEIPKEFAYIPTLHVIEVVGCSFGVETSAKQIPQEQEECLGSTMTIVRVSGSP
ncbi:unnamed protein product [Withania somnifera]